MFRMIDRAAAASQPEFARGVLPCPEPLPEVVEIGLFGNDEQGAICPDPGDVRAMTLEHARELTAVLGELDHVRHCAACGIDPISGKTPRHEARREQLAERLAREAAKLEWHYEEALAAYAEAFGWEAADALDRFVRENRDEPSREPPRVQQSLF